jgi:hypothetical protein
MRILTTKIKWYPLKAFSPGNSQVKPGNQTAFEVYAMRSFGAEMESIENIPGKLHRPRLGA